MVKEYSDDYLKDLTDLMNQWSDEPSLSENDIADSVVLVREKSGNKIFLAVNENDKAIGYVLTGICYYLGFKPFVEIIQLMVDKNNRSLGIGASLIRFVEGYYKDYGIDKIRLHSRIERDRAHRFYMRFGFTEYKQSKFFEKDIG